MENEIVCFFIFSVFYTVFLKIKIDILKKENDELKKENDELKKKTLNFR